MIFDEPQFRDQLSRLRINLLNSLNHFLQNASGISNDTRAKRYKAKEASLVESYVRDCNILFLSHETVMSFCNDPDDTMFVETQGNATFRILAMCFISELTMAIKRGGRGSQTMDELVEKALAKHINPDVSEKSLLRQTIYNISGWLVKAIKKKAALTESNVILKKALQKVNEASANITADEAKSQNLPTERVESRFSSVRLRFPSKPFFKMVLLIETICEQVLVEKSILIFGATVTDELAKAIEKVDLISQFTKKCCHQSNQLTNSEVIVVTSFIVQTYMKMRTRDYVRNLVGKTRKSLSQGTRPTLAVVSQGGMIPKKEGIEKDGIVCFFCLGKGHTVTDCVAVKIAPQSSSPTHRMVKISTKMIGIVAKQIEWHWCGKCKEWRGHSTIDHVDPVTLMADSDEVDHVVEMQNIIQNIVKDY